MYFANSTLHFESLRKRAGLSVLWMSISDELSRKDYDAHLETYVLEIVSYFEHVTWTLQHKILFRGHIFGFLLSRRLVCLRTDLALVKVVE